MLSWAIKKVFGTAHERTVRRMRPRVDAINALEPKIKKLSDSELRAKTAEFKQRIDNGESLDDLLIEAFAVCREAGWRVMKMRHYDVQLVGGMVLHSGSIAEMRTGEGKTLVATLPCYLNALEGKGVHVVTVNDYLAQRDAEWMGRLHGFLGLEVGCVYNQQDDFSKKAAYQADITYGQNNEFGFDYLRDNMKFSALDYVQRPLHYAIVDEVDSILIDEARTPLIISGQGEKSSDKYRIINAMIPRLRLDEHYVVDEKGHNVSLTDEGVELAEDSLGVNNLYEVANLESLHVLNQCLRAHSLYKRDQHYMVREGEIIIVDEFTGRAMEGRRWSDGLHQAVEAKEEVEIQEESRTMATITFQNLFRMYKKLSGMTGTADTEASEFHSTYKLDCTVIPTNRPIQRIDYEDVVYKTEREKFRAMIKEIMEVHEAGRPVLVGTTSVEKSAAVAQILKKKKVPHNVLNAKHHGNEAVVVAQAGSAGAITVSTNMAGRGTDIVLGGNAEMIAKEQFRESGRVPEDAPEEFEELVTMLTEECEAAGEEIKEAGGLHIIGTERHESRRIDNQLRGRAGRQGDPGSSRFYLSLEDDLMRIFAGDQVKNLMERMGMPDDEPIEHPWVTKSVVNAQGKVEMRNFDIRKNVLEYDDVMNAQRKTVYQIRQDLLSGHYEREELDEDFEPTGKMKKFAPREDILADVVPSIGQLLSYFCEPPVSIEEERDLTAEDFEDVGRVNELEGLRREIYSYWGVVVDCEKYEEDAAGLFRLLEKEIPLSLTEQRERILDLIDRVLCTMIEEACPVQKPPEDWEWGAVYDTVNDLIGSDPEGVEDIADQEKIAHFLFEAAEKKFVELEGQTDTATLMRTARQLYLQEIDRAWVDHLTNMEHLRDGIGLRGYGQRDPKQEYKKEGYNLFTNMMASISLAVVKQLLNAEVVDGDEDAPDPYQGLGYESAGFDDSASGLDEVAQSQLELAQAAALFQQSLQQAGGAELTGGGDLTGGALTGGNLTGGALTGGDLTGGDLTGGALTGGDLTGGALTGGDLTGGGELTGGDLTGSPEEEAADDGDDECPCGSGKPFGECHGALETQPRPAD